MQDRGAVFKSRFMEKSHFGEINQKENLPKHRG